LLKITAVHPDYRGRGIATFLKAVNIKMLIENGASRFESSSANPAMLKINEKLGYKLNGLAEIRLAKFL
jgi:predicted GNAT family acetyltransferase